MAVCVTITTSSTKPKSRIYLLLQELLVIQEELLFHVLQICG